MLKTYRGGGGGLINKVMLIVTSKGKDDLHKEALLYALDGVTVLFFQTQQALDAWHQEQRESQ
jgi:hypothetical protein